MISHDEDDGIDNADGTGFRAVSGPTLGCLECHAEVSTRWDADWSGDWYVVCDECLGVLATEAI